MARAVRVDVLDRLADAIHDFHRQHEVEVFLVPIGGGGRGDLDAAAVEQGLRRFVAAQLDVGLGQALGQAGQHVGGDGLVNQQRLGGVANPGPVYFRVEDDLLRHRGVGVGVDVNVANALVMLDDRHVRALCHGTNETLAAARNAEVNEARERKQLGDGTAIGRRHDLYGVRRESRQSPGRGLDHDLCSDLVRVNGFLAAAKNRCVAGLETEARRVDGDVGA